MGRTPNTYNYKLKPTVKELLSKSDNYRVKIIEGQKVYEHEKIRLQKVKETLEQRCAKGGQVSSIEWNRLDKEIEALGIKSRERINVEIRLRNGIALLAGHIATMWVELSGDLDLDLISHNMFLEYLKQYKQVLENTNGLECYTKPPFDKIREAINKNIPNNN